MIFKTMLKGAAIGVANIIPGVSGGTMALMLGVYEQIIELLSTLKPKDLFSALKSKAAFLQFWKEKNITFFACLGVGAVVAIAALSKILKYFLLEAHDPTYGFFFGLILASIVVPWKMLKTKTIAVYIATVLGVLSVVGISTSMSPEERIQAAETKIAIKAKAKTDGATGAAALTTSEYMQFFVAGGIAISAMILPGLSGSFILLLLGMYFDVLEAIGQFNVVLLGVFAVGCIVGLLLFTRLLRILLKNYHDPTLGYLTGLVAGSLYAIWPFKDYVMVGGQTRIDTGNILPNMAAMNTWYTVASILVGVGLVVLFLQYEKNTKKQQN